MASIVKTSPATGWTWVRRALWAFAIILGLVGAGIVYLVLAKPWASERELVAPLTGGVRISEEQVLGNYYASAGRAAGSVLVLNGADGGISKTADGIAQALSREGINALVLSYWGAPGQPLEMEELPLEAFDHAIKWLKDRPESTGRIAIVGYSKGAEAALLYGAHRQGLSAIVAGAPTYVSWQAPGPVGAIIGGTSTFSDGGKALPFIPYSNVNFFAGPGPFEIHSKSLLNAADHEEAEIAIERIGAPLLLLCGTKDTVWPACPMAEHLMNRAVKGGRPPPVLLTYANAGHGVLGPPPVVGGRADPLIGRSTREADISARRDAWPQVVSFLQGSLGS